MAGMFVTAVAQRIAVGGDGDIRAFISHLIFRLHGPALLPTISCLLFSHGLFVPFWLRPFVLRDSAEPMETLPCPNVLKTSKRSSCVSRMIFSLKQPARVLL